MQHANFVWNELMTSDVEKAKAFFASVIGWTFDSMPMPDGTYYVAKHDGKPVAGIMKRPATVPPDVPNHWLSYLEVDNIDERLKLFTANGGTVHRQPWDIPGVGRIAIVSEPTGAAMGLMTSAPS